MKTNSRFHGLRIRKLHHRGLVLSPGPRGSWDGGAASLGCAFVDEDDPDNVFLFYSGAPDVRWSHGATGLAVSKDGLSFTKVGDDPVIDGSDHSFYAREAVFPAVVRVGGRFYMVFTCRSSDRSPRMLGIAYADDVMGPWNVIRRLITPCYAWEGDNIDNGPGIARLGEDTILVFYSNLSGTLTFGKIVGQGLRRLHIPFSYFYFVRRVGVLKVRIRGTRRSKIEALRYVGNPLGHLNGPKGSWNESLFCPGYMLFEKTSCLFPAASIYSSHAPRQFVGFAASATPFFPAGETGIRRLIDGSAERGRVMPGSVGELALDTPCPLLRSSGDEVFLYYGVMDRREGVWKTGLSTFVLEEG